MHITILVPAAWIACDDPLDLGARAWIEARGGLVEKQHFGSQRPRACEREALLLAAGQHARRPFRKVPEPDAAERVARLARALDREDSGEPERVLDVRDRRSPEHHRPLEDHRLATPFAGPLGRRPVDAAGRRRQETVTEAHEHALAGAVRPENDGPGAGVEHERDPIDDRALAGDERDVVQSQRQDRCRRAHRFVTHSAAGRLP